MQIAPPLPNESREDYTIRSHRALLATVPDPNQRNQIVWNACDQYFANAERERAEQFFPSEQFEHRRDVCLWHEHETETIGPDGQPAVKRNDVERIKAIVRENNLRIADTDAYSAIVDKHTVPSGQRDPLPPRTIGFAGPYRIGMIGRVQPKFALFADEHRRLDEAATFRDRPRRSVEVLTLRANGRSYIDPIAALSEAPRLPLPVQYSAGEQGVVERYQAEPVSAEPERYEGDGGGSASYAGGSNTYIPGWSGRKNMQRFDALSSGEEEPNAENGLMLAPEDLKQIVEAIQSTPQFQFLNQLMAGGQPGGEGQSGQQPASTPAEPAPPAGNPHAGPPQAGSPAQPAAKEPYIAPMAAAGAGMLAGGAMANRFSATAPESELEPEGTEVSQITTEQYAALQQQNATLTEQYAAMNASLTNLMQENAGLKRGYAELRASAADANRKLRISDLHNRYPHMVDVQEEESRCLYSAGSTMDDDAFEHHCEMVEKYAAKAPVMTPMVPSGEFQSRSQSRTVETDRYEAALSSAAVEYHASAQARGEHLTYEQCVEAVKDKVQV